MLPEVAEAMQVPSARTRLDWLLETQTVDIIWGYPKGPRPSAQAKQDFTTSISTKFFPWQQH